MNIIVIANIFSFAGATIMVGIGFIKSKNKILLAQIFQSLLMGIGNYLLGGITGLFANLITALRNIITYRFGINLPIKLLVILAQVGMGVLVNDQGWLGWLPIIASVIFTWYCDLDSDFEFKIMVTGTTFFWLSYDFAMRNYSAFAFDVFAVFSNAVGLLRIIKSKTE